MDDTPLFRRSRGTMPYCTRVQYTSAIGANHQLSAPTITVKSARQSARKSSNTTLCYPKPIETSSLRENLKKNIVGGQGELTRAIL
jgi:hypothetical protein